jgi:hypothetical protein
MEPAVRQKSYGTLPGEKTEKVPQEGREVQDWETKLGKIIFYITCATALWFFYWLNGIQCPC